MNIYGDRLQAAMTLRGSDRKAVAKAIGRSVQAVGDVILGKTKAFTSENNSKAAEFLKVRPDWLATGDGPMLSAPGNAPSVIDLSNNPDYPSVRRVQFKLSAGASGFGVDYLGEDDPPIVFKRAWFESNGYRPEALFAVRVANGSMEPGLYDGDTVVVNTGQTEPKDGKVFAVNYEGEMVIKRLVRDAGEWWLCSDNPDQRRHPRKLAHAGAILLGEIVHKQSERI